MSQSVSDLTFEKEIANSKGFALVDFWAEWCGPCRQLGPIIEEIAIDLSGKVKVMKMNVDENPEMPSKLGIRGIPTLILFQDGKQVATKVGSMPKASILDWLNSEIA